MLLVYQATYSHARNLAIFVLIYKSLVAGQKYLQGKEESYRTFIAGLIGGYVVFGENNAINNQVFFLL